MPIVGILTIPATLQGWRLQEASRQQVNEQRLVDAAERIQVGDGNLFIGLVNGGVERPQFNDLGAGRGNETAIGGAAAGG